jgi:phosphatidylinositol alpha-1,6-mannosyltransferase
MAADLQKYLLFTLEYPPFRGGVSRYYQNLSGYWPGGDFFILADDALGGRDEKKIKYRPLLNRYLRPRWLPAVWHLYKEIRGIKRLFSAADREKPAVQVIVGQILPLGIAAYFLSKFSKFSYSVVLHGLDFSLALKTRWKRKITGKILARADKIICANKYTANLVKTFSVNLAEKVFVANPGIEPFFVRNPQRVRELQDKYSLAGKTVLFGLGRLVRRKGFDRVIEAMPAVSRVVPQTVCVIGGNGPEEAALKKMVSDLPKEVKKNIIFVGQLSEEDRWAWLELCDIFIMASRNIDGDFEGFGIVYLEANLAGKPVIAGDSGGVRDAVIDGINGLLVDSENPDDIARAIIKLSSDAKLRQALGEQGKRRAVESFNAKKQAEKFYNFIRSQEQD